MKYLAAAFMAAFPAEYAALWFLFQHPILWVHRK